MPTEAGLTDLADQILETPPDGAFDSITASDRLCLHRRLEGVTLGDLLGRQLEPYLDAPERLRM